MARTAHVSERVAKECVASDRAARERALSPPPPPRERGDQIDRRGARGRTHERAGVRGVTFRGVHDAAGTTPRGADSADGTSVASAPAPACGADGASDASTHALAVASTARPWRRRRRVPCVGARAHARRRTWGAANVDVARELEEHAARRVVGALAELEIGQYLARTEG